MRPDLEDFDELSNADESPRSRLVSWLVLGLAVGGFASLAYYAYNAGTQSQSADGMMVVAADQGPIKEVPTDPEGEHFANQDKTIYEVISPNGSSNVEKLLPEPEKPITDVREALAKAPEAPAVVEKPAVPAAPAVAPAAAQPAPVAAAVVPAPAPVAVAPTPAPAATTYVKKETTKPEPVKEAKKEEKKPAANAPAPLVSSKPSPAPAAPVATTKAEEVTIPASEPEDSAPEVVNEAPVAAVEKPAEPKPEPVKEAKKEAIAKPAAKEEKPAEKKEASGSYQLQLGAYQSEEEARASWKKISAKHAGVLSGGPTIVKAELANGTFYRLRAGSFASSAAAKAACGKMAGQACFPVGK